VTTRLTMLLIAALATAALAIGCGGGDDGGEGGSTVSGSSNSDSSQSGEPTVTTSSLSKAAFVKKADGLCRLGAEKALSYQSTDPEKANLPEDQLLPEAIEATIAPSFQEVVDQIQELGAPSGDELQVEAFLDALQQEIDVIEERRTSVSSFAKLEALLRRSSALARDYGLESCVYSS
jgi:hypothetical protein